MKHEPEFHKPPERDMQTPLELAKCYARLFATDDGARVLADLRRKFGLSRLVWSKGEQGRYDTIAAALTDGERRVMSEIENAIATGSVNSKPNFAS